MSDGALRVDRDGHVAEVVLDQPGRLNAMSPAFFHEIRRVFEEIEGDREVRAILIWAEGRIFSSGLDLGQAEDLRIPAPEDLSEAARSQLLYETIRDFQDAFLRVRRSKRPVIAAIHGWCIGGGLDLVTACDIRLASADASFAIHETKMAMVADLGTLQRITALVGRGLAREMAFTGDLIPAHRALAFGLVNDIFPDKASLLEAARGMARRIAANSPRVVAGVKEILDHAEEHTETEGLERVAWWNTAYFQSRDLEEAIRAHREKREPRFDGR